MTKSRWDWKRPFRSLTCANRGPPSLGGRWKKKWRSFSAHVTGSASIAYGPRAFLHDARDAHVAGVESLKLDTLASRHGLIPLPTVRPARLEAFGAPTPQELHAAIPHTLFTAYIVFSSSREKQFKSAQSQRRVIPRIVSFFQREERARELGGVSDAFSIALCVCVCVKTGHLSPVVVVVVVVSKTKDSQVWKLGCSSVDSRGRPAQTPPAARRRTLRLQGLRARRLLARRARHAPRRAARRKRIAARA